MTEYLAPIEQMPTKVSVHGVEPLIPKEDIQKLQRSLTFVPPDAPREKVASALGDNLSLGMRLMDYDVETTTALIKTQLKEVRSAQLVLAEVAVKDESFTRSYNRLIHGDPWTFRHVLGWVCAIYLAILFIEWLFDLDLHAVFRF
jgi:hypothetical protein